MRLMLSNEKKPLFTIKTAYSTCYIFTLLLYGAEAWTLREHIMENIENLSNSGYIEEY